MNSVNIICGVKGLGKSEYSTNRWPTYFVIECDIPILGNSYSVIEAAIYKDHNKFYESNEKMISNFYDILNDKNGIIIDNAELINNDSLKLIINIAKQKNKEIVFIFDIPYKKLHTSSVFLLLLEWNLINIDTQVGDFCVDLETIRQFFFNNFPHIVDTEFDKVIKITGKNFNEIKKLMWINKTYNNSNSFLTEEVISIYLEKWLGDELIKISPMLADVLKKSSIIGETFEKQPLEHKNGFNILGVTNHLEELEKQEIFISKHTSKKDSFKFINCDVYSAVLSSISSTQKIEWHSTLKEYYTKIFSLSQSTHVKIEALVLAKRSASTINDSQAIFEINQALLFEYFNSNDLLNAIRIIDEIVFDANIVKEKPYIDYLLSLKIQILFDFGDYKKALDIIENRFRNNYYTGSWDYLNYFYIKCLFCCGNIDSAYSEINKLINKLKITSKSGNINQKIYPLTYSMMATIQNHLNLEDSGLRYYKLALNYAKNSLDDNLYYDILSKSDMFCSNELACNNLSECVDYYKKIHNMLKLGKAYVNLATEMLFEGCGSTTDIENYLASAESVFLIPDENLAYVKNNLALYYIISKNDFIKAIQELERALLVDLSEFTYMTIYLNLVMCYFIVEGRNSEKFKHAYQKFIKYEELVGSRANASRYESTYRTICDLIVLDNSKESIENICNKYLSLLDDEDFFYPIFEDIKNRTCGNLDRRTYQNNCNFYKAINDKGIFLAEFRFWE